MVSSSRCPSGSHKGNTEAKDTTCPMHDAHSPMHSNEYHFYDNVETEASSCKMKKDFFFQSMLQNKDFVKLLENLTLNCSFTCA